MPAVKKGFSLAVYAGMLPSFWRVNSAIPNSLNRSGRSLRVICNCCFLASASLASRFWMPNSKSRKLRTASRARSNLSAIGPPGYDHIAISPTDNAVAGKKEIIPPRILHPQHDDLSVCRDDCVPLHRHDMVELHNRWCGDQASNKTPAIDHLIFSVATR